MTGCNEKNCTCSNNNCERHGKCCECVNFHRSNGNIVSCLRDLNIENK